MLELSCLAHTWILDVDGTIVKHNGYKIDGHDTLLKGVKEFFEKIPKCDKIILLTARNDVYLEDLKKFLKKNNLRYDYILANMPTGERILINDKKPSGLNCAHAINKKRDGEFYANFTLNQNL